MQHKRKTTPWFNVTLQATWTKKSKDIGNTAVLKTAHFWSKNSLWAECLALSQRDQCFHGDPLWCGNEPSVLGCYRTARQNSESKKMDGEIGGRRKWKKTSGLRVRNPFVSSPLGFEVDGWAHLSGWAKFNLKHGCSYQLFSQRVFLTIIPLIIHVIR